MLNRAKTSRLDNHEKLGKFVENEYCMGVAQQLDKEISHYLGHLSTEQKRLF